MQLANTTPGAQASGNQPRQTRFRFRGESHLVGLLTYDWHVKMHALYSVADLGQQGELIVEVTRGGVKTRQSVNGLYLKGPGRTKMRLAIQDSRIEERLLLEVQLPAGVGADDCYDRLRRGISRLAKDHGAGVHNLSSEEPALVSIDPGMNASLRHLAIDLIREGTEPEKKVVDVGKPVAAWASGTSAAQTPAKATPEAVAVNKPVEDGTDMTNTGSTGAPANSGHASADTAKSANANSQGARLQAFLAASNQTVKDFAEQYVISPPTVQKLLKDEETSPVFSKYVELIMAGNKKPDPVFSKAEELMIGKILEIVDRKKAFDDLIRLAVNRWTKSPTGPDARALSISIFRQYLACETDEERVAALLEFRDELKVGDHNNPLRK